jgi:drug/metabolite transporter (DMT)-like permease
MAAVTEVSLTAPTSRPLSATAVAIMLLLCLSWGFNQVSVKLALPDFPPLLQAAIRSVGALVVVLIGVRIRGLKIFKRDGTLGAGIVMGVLFALEFVFINIGLTFTTATRAIIFLYTTPFFIALGAYALLGERLAAMQWAGMTLSFSGVVAAIGIPQDDVTARVMIGDIMLIGGALAWAATTLMFKATRLASAPAEKAMVYQLAVSGPLLFLFAWFAGERMTHWPGVIPLAAFTYQTVWVVGCTFLIYLMLMKSYAVSKLAAFTFITPLFGVAAGHYVLNEPLSAGFALAVVLVVAGLVLVNRRSQPVPRVGKGAERRAHAS